MLGNTLPLLSICCLGYNHAKFLEENLNSIKNIGYDNIEVVIVDDGSKDNSLDILNNIKKEFRLPIKIISQKNTGNIGKNFNNAYKEANGEFITFISLDDVYNPKVMLKQINTLIDNPTLAFVASSKVVSINSEGFINSGAQALSLFSREKCTINDLLELEYSEFGAFYIQGAIFKKSIVDAVDAFDEDMTGDDIILRTKIFRYLLEKPEYEFKIMHENACFYRLHDNNVHKKTSRQIKIVTEYLEKYWKERENPKILINWMCYYINNSKFEEYIRVFSMNTKTINLLENERIKIKIKESIIKENNKFLTFFKAIYKKKKNEDGSRTVTLFSLLKFTYSSRRNQDVNIHYSTFK
ncbi:glycosyltransferase family 2 protein [Pectobacterium versatile]|uniref:glycosyltransferase family 2 protein n=1 Tax=Pectobacterium versatile TaxID=2488639 RepID=UPI001B35A01D|nr:glycosyltransferase family A protein [Pectobacterium versatile]MBQ4777226.1 glycosyltransferase [Pectobacterium versatile]GKW33395.1 hypothetical protein PEC730217_21750 [Pectobacterium carotovorum subsp. carotovorum]